MNYRNRITLAISGILAAASVQTTDGAQSKAPPPELIESMPNEARNPSGPVGRTYAPLGAEWAGKILQAEQGVVQAGENLSSTKLSGLLAALEVGQGTPEDRATFISGMDAAFIGADGGSKKSKTHQNYIGEIRRVFFNIDTIGAEKVKELLNQPGTYPDRVGRLQKTNDGRGGGNKGTGAKAAQQTATEAYKAGKDVQQALANPPAGTDVTPNPRGENQPEASTTEMVRLIRTCHESQLLDLWSALAERSAQQTTASPLLRELGNATLLKLQKAEGTQPATAEIPAPELKQKAVH